MLQEISEELELTDDQLKDISGACAGLGLGLGGGLHLGFGGGLRGPRFGGGFFGGSFGGFAPLQTVAVVPVQQTVVESVPVTETTTTALQTTSCGC